MFRLFVISVFIIKIIVATHENGLFPTLPHIIETTESTQCQVDNNIYKAHLENFTLWAYEMLDASPKDTYSILQGGDVHFGNWEQCIYINGPFTTQYCLAAYTAQVSVYSTRDPTSHYYDPYESVLEKFRKSDDVSKRSRNVVKLGLCLPASCSPKDIEQYYNGYLKKLDNRWKNHNVTYSLAVDNKLCQTKNSSKAMDELDILFCILCILLVIVVTIATIHDFQKKETDDIDKLNQEKRKHSVMESICLAFSAKHNFSELFSPCNSKQEFKIFHGIKALSLLVVIFGHKMLLISLAPTINFDFVENFERSPIASLSLNSGLFVDTFFTISGLLLSYSWLNKTETSNINPFNMILLRCIRLTPLYAFIIFYGATMYYYSGVGPMWNTFVATESQDCRNNWWKSLLFVNNYVDSKNACMPVTWYIACDLHLFILGTFVLTALQKNKRLGYTIITLLFIISLLIPFGQILYYKIPPIIQYFPETLHNLKKNEFFNLIYVKSHNRAVSYIMGLVAGIIYWNLEKKSKLLSNVKFYVVTTGAIVIILACLLSGAPFYIRHWKINKFLSAVYLPFVKTAWSAATIGIFFAAAYSYENLITSMLSCRIFVPISKLAYGIYLVHYPMQFTYFSTRSTFQHLSMAEIIYGFTADAVLAIVLALILYICVEAPAKHICKVMLRRNIEK